MVNEVGVCQPRLRWKIITYSSNINKCILFALAWIVGPIIKLINEIYYSCERQEYILLYSENIE